MFSNRNPSATVESPLHRGSEEWFQRLKKDFHKQLIEGMNLRSVHALGDHELRGELRVGIEGLSDASNELLTRDERERLITEIIDETLGLGPLDPLMRDPTVSDVLINGPKNVFVERRGRLELTNIVFRDEQHLLEIVQRFASRAGRRLDESNPMVDTRLEDGSRVNAVIPPLALDGTLVSIRRFSSRPLDAAALIARKSVAPEMIDFVAACVRARMNIVISGGTGSGKTTFLNLLSSFIPDSERIVTIEDAAELRLQQRHVARMETRPANVEGQGEITARDLLRNSLRMRPDRIIVGECRGGEAFDMIQSMTTGHDGSMSTIHANDCRDSVNRMEMLVGLAGFDLPISFIHRMIVSAVDILIHCARVDGGTRKIVQISEIAGLEGDIVTLHDIFKFDQLGTDAEKNAVGHFRATGIRPRCLQRLEVCGQKLPRGLFENRVLQNDRVSPLEYSRRS